MPRLSILAEVLNQPGSVPGLELSAGPGVSQLPEAPAGVGVTPHDSHSRGLVGPAQRPWFVSPAALLGDFQLYPLKEFLLTKFSPVTHSLWKLP